MLPRRSDDLALMLSVSGVLVTLGASSTHAIVKAADAELLRQNDSPVAVAGRAVTITLQAGTLTGLAIGSAVSVTEGPLTGSYTVDRILLAEDGGLTRCLGYPA